MSRASMTLWGALSLVAFEPPVAVTAPIGGAGSPSCEQPSGPTAAPAPTSQTDTMSMMRQWLAEYEAVSQMDAWWQERTWLPDAPASTPSHLKEGTSQMDAWWRERRLLGHALARKPVPPVQHRRHRIYSVAPMTEFGCPPSVCSK
jgi:hypothetical protein